MSYPQLYPSVQDPPTRQYYVGKPEMLPPSAIPAVPEPIIVYQKPPSKVRSFFQSFVTPTRLVDQPVSKPMPPATAPAGEPNYGMQPNTYAPTTTTRFDFYHQVANHCPVDKLLRHGLNEQTAMEANLTAADFYEANYSLQDLAKLFPRFEQLQALQLNKHLLGDKWPLQALSAFYQIPAAELCQRLQLTIEDFTRSRLTAVQLVQTGMTWQQLREMGINYRFILESGLTPQHFAALGGRLEDLQKLDFTDEQKKTLHVNRWNTFGLTDIPGVLPINACRIWLTIPH